MGNWSFTGPDRWRFTFAFGAWLLVAAALAYAPFPVVWGSFVVPFAAIAALVIVFVTYRRFRPDEVLSRAVLVTAQVALFAVGMEILNYLSFAWKRPLIDGWLVSLDRAIGFDWMAMVAWLQDHPAIGQLLHVAYGISLPQVPAILLLLAITGRTARLDRFTLSFMIGATLTVGFWIAFRSFGAYHYFFALGEAVPPTGLGVNIPYAAHMSAWHAGNFVPLRLADMQGLIAFPSFHTVLAVISMLALLEFRFLGFLGVIINVLVILSVPAQGGHHLVDVFAGILVAAVAWYLAGRIVEAGKRSAQPAMIREPARFIPS
jgi:hypothetical protein